MLNWIQLLYLCWVLNMSIFRSVLEYIYLSKNLLSAQSVIPFTLLLSTQYLYFCIGAWVLNKSKFCMEIEWISYNHFSTQFQTILCIYWVLNISIFVKVIEYSIDQIFVWRLSESAETIFLLNYRQSYVSIECSMWYTFNLSIEHSRLAFLYRWLSTQ